MNETDIKEVDVVKEETVKAIITEEVLTPVTLKNGVQIKVFCKINRDPETNEIIPSEDNNMANVIKATNEYKTKHHFMLADEVIALRKFLGLNEKDMAGLIGLRNYIIYSTLETDPTYIQSHVMNTVLTLVKASDANVKILSQINNDLLSEEARKMFKKRFQ